MDAVKARNFKEALDRFRDYLASGGKWTRDDKMAEIANLEDNWYEPACFSYNLLGQYDMPKYIRSQYESARAVEPGKVFIYVQFPIVGLWITKDELYTNYMTMEDD